MWGSEAGLIGQWGGTSWLTWGGIRFFDGAPGRQGRGTNRAPRPSPLPEPRQLHSFLQVAARWPESDCGRRGQHPVHLGPGGAHPPHQGRADLLGPCLLRPGCQPRRQGLLFLLQRRQHRGLGPAEPDHGQVGGRRRGAGQAPASFPGPLWGRRGGLGARWSSSDSRRPARALPAPGSSRATRMVPAVLTFPTTALDSGRGAWTTPCAAGTCERAASCSSMTSAPRCPTGPAGGGWTLQQAHLPPCPPEPPWSRRRAGPRACSGSVFPVLQTQAFPFILQRQMHRTPEDPIRSKPWGG